MTPESGRLDLRAVREWLTDLEDQGRALPREPLHDAVAKVRALYEYVVALRAALQPFADRAEYYRRADEGTMLHTERVMVEVGDLRRAAEVLNAAVDAAGAAPEETPHE